VEINSGHQDAFGMARWRSEFSNHVTETQFLARQLGQTKSQLRSALIFCSFFYLLFSLTDIAVLGYGSDSKVLFWARLAVALTAAVSVFVTYRRPDSVALARLAACAVEVVGMAVFMLIVAYRPDEIPWHAMSMAIMLVVIYIFIPNRLAYALAIALTATAVFIVLVLKIDNLKPTDLLTMSMLLTLANAFGGVAAWRYNRLAREEFRARANLETVSVIDHLTGCFNRRYLHEKLLDKEVARAQRYRVCLTVILCDLDHFKQVNDSYGHHGGDAVLRNFAQLLKGMTREHIDSVVRYGGEEFLLILPETDLSGGILLAERLRSTFAATRHAVNHNSSLTASFGVACVDFAGYDKAISLYGLIETADEQLYLAKRGGRNQVTFRQIV
jgi:diguanylate cyclase (GGDEF)-like protein